MTSYDRTTGVGDDEFGSLIAAWFDAEARSREPAGLLEATLARTARTRRIPGWLLPERWIPMQLTMRLQPVPRMAGILVILALLVALVAAMLYLGAPRRVLDPFGPAANGRIAYSSEGDIFTADPDGGNPRRVTSGSQIDGRPIWSHVGSNVAFLRWPATGTGGADLVVLDVDGGQPVTIAQDATGMSVPSWSPDGRAIAYSQGDPPTIYVAPADGSSLPTRLLALGLAEAPIWSPDGRRLAYTSPTGRGHAVWVANADGTDRKQLSKAYVDMPHGFGHGATGHAWSPDGSAILFTAGDDATQAFDLYVVRSAGGSPERRVSTAAGPEYGATWSPDGTQISFIQAEPYEHGLAMVANADGSGARPVISDPVMWFTPQWSPDGSMLAVLPRPPADEEGIVFVDVATGEVRQTIAFTPVSYEDDAPGSGDAPAFERLLP